MPWQADWADVAYEIDPATGHFAYREIVTTIMRQQGKTTFVLARELDTCLNTPGGVAVYTAQTGSDARKKLLETHVPLILESKRLRPLVQKVLQAKGEEAIKFVNGSRIALNAGTSSSGHGDVVDTGVIDEAFKDVDDRREQALLPAMLTKADGQLLVVSTQGTAASAYLNRKCELGRQAAAEDSGTGIAYLEYSADKDDDPSDPEVWWRCMPALGITISEAAVAHAFDTMDLPDFRRAMLNIRDSSDSSTPIPMDLWRKVVVDRVVPEGDLVLGVEAAIDRGSASLVVADDAGRVELVDCQPGTRWVPARVAELVARWGCRVVLDPRGPARGEIQGLQKLGVEVEELTTAEVVAAALGMVDAVADRQIRVGFHPAFDVAVETACKRWSGEQWFWDRRNSSGDVSPLSAASLARFAAALAPQGNDDKAPNLW